MAAHKHSWRYSPSAEHRSCECGAEQTLQARENTCGLRHWGPASILPRKKTKAGDGAGRFYFIGNSMIPAGEYVAAKYYDEAVEKITALQADILRMSATEMRKR